MTKFKQHWKALTPVQKTRLVEATGLAKSFISRIAHGHINPTLSTMKKIVDSDKKVRFTWFVEPDPE